MGCLYAADHYETVWNASNARCRRRSQRQRVVHGYQKDDAAELGKRNPWRYGTLTKPCNQLVVNMFYGLVKVWC